MMTRRWVLTLFLVGACSGDTGPEGPSGPEGGQGGQGSQGEPGPITDPPMLTALSPRWGSADTRVTITGTGFSTTAADNTVTFDGHTATVISATATQLVVTPDVATADSDFVGVNVEVANQVSNALVFELVAPGTARYLEVPLPSAPTGVVAVGNDVYIASGVNGTARTGGLFKLSAGTVTQVVAGELVTVNANGSSLQIIDGPVAVAAFAGNVYFTTTFGSVRKLTVATGVVTDVFTLPSANGNDFPVRTGLAFDNAGNMYLIDRNANAIVRVLANGTVGLITGLAPDIYGLASDGTDLFVSHETAGDGSVTRITTPAGTPTVTPIDDVIVALRGITTVGSDVVAATANGLLVSVPKSGGQLTIFGATAGYVDEAVGLAAQGTDILLAQPAGGVVRRKPAATNDATIIAAGVRIAFGTVELGGKWYFSTLGSSAMNGLSLFQKDGAVVEVTATGASRVLATTRSPLGLTVSGATQLTVSDCLEQRIFTLDVATAAQTDRLTSTAFTDCPVGVAVDATGTLFYVDASDTNTATIGKLVGTTQTASFGTGFTGDTVVLVGGQLVSGVVFDDSDPQTPALGVQKVAAATGGAASTLVPATAFNSGALAASPDGVLYGMRSLSGQLVTIDVATGVVTPIGSTVPPESPVRPSLSGSFVVAADHTITLMDVLQGDLISVAP